MQRNHYVQKINYNSCNCFNLNGDGSCASGIRHLIKACSEELLAADGKVDVRTSTPHWQWLHDGFIQERFTGKECTEWQAQLKSSRSNIKVWIKIIIYIQP